MVKARKGNAVILGLTEKNIELMKQDKPIKLNLKDLGLADIDIYIFAGKDESAMIDMFYENIGPDTVLK